MVADVINSHTALCSRANVEIPVQTRRKIFGLRKVNLELQREYAMPNCLGSGKCHRSMITFSNVAV